MRYVSIDLETLGLNYQTCDMIEFGAVVDDLKVQAPLEELPRFHCYIEKENYRGEPYAMAMHSKILKRIATKEKGWKYVSDRDLGRKFLFFLGDVGFKIGDVLTIAGKNYGTFDRDFLKEVPGFFQTINASGRFHHRVFDIGPLFFDSLIDSEIPNLKTCMERAGVEGEVKHTAVEDCLDVIRCIRSKCPKSHCVD